MAEIFDFIAANNPGAAERTLRRIVKTTQRLETLPKSGRPGSIPGTRELVIPGLPYIVLDVVGENSIDIHGVYHTPRHPRVRQKAEPDEF